MRSFKTLAIAFIFTFSVCIGGSGAVFASDYDDVYENEVDEDTELTVDGIERQDIDAFLEAAEKISEIRAEYSEKILEAAEGDNGDESYEDLREEANDKMVKAIEDAGLYEEIYRGIAYHLQEDEDLFSKIE
ncbi:MAG: DUF4168 domain-containing protein [Thermodesulfobacteriota bacterium]